MCDISQLAENFGEVETLRPSFPDVQVTQKISLCVSHKTLIYLDLEPISELWRGVTTLNCNGTNRKTTKQKDCYLVVWVPGIPYVSCFLKNYKTCILILTKSLYSNAAAMAPAMLHPMMDLWLLEVSLGHLFLCLGVSHSSCCVSTQFCTSNIAGS